MKPEVVAIIPARSGSKGIPNKNIRFVNGKPLVAYVIECALKSKRITRVIVSTDSPEVKIIAQQLGTELRERSADLCGDSVTLDVVIYDAVKEIACDYVVTLQPTSPTLKTATLDKAIDYAIEQQMDTVIAARNRPHLAWTRNEVGEIIPAYKARLNRQYLPPYYTETGAFVISHRSVVTETSRIGSKMTVFEVPEAESIDVDDFDDLLVVEHILKGQRVAFYVNGNNARGTGHVYRVLELADQFCSKVDIFFDQNQTNISIFGVTTHRLIAVDGLGDLLTHLKTGCYTLLINDILDTTIDYMIAVRKALMPGAKIVNFEDGGEGAAHADAVFNALFQTGDLPHIRAGEKFFISSKLFMYYKPIAIRERVERVFISFGGADPSDYTDRLLSIISRPKYANLQFEVVLGRAKKNIPELMALNGQIENVHLYCDIVNMPEIMSKCDVGVTSRGRTGYELAMLGIPSIAMAQNKREEKHGFVCAENGFSYLGLHPSDWIIESTLDSFVGMSAEDRSRIQAQLLSHDLRNGRQRVMDIINCL